MCINVEIDFINVIEKYILEWTVGKYGGRVWTGFIWLKIRTIVGLL
jgi:hypothetical protein